MYRIFQNKLTEQSPEIKYLQCSLEGTKENPDALGAQVVLRFSDGTFQYHQQQLSRGYMSSVDPTVYFGIPKSKSISTLEVLWPNGAFSSLENPSPNQRYTFSQQNSTLKSELSFPFKEKEKEYLFSEVSSSYGIDYVHEEKNVLSVSCVNKVNH